MQPYPDFWGHHMRYIVPTDPLMPSRHVSCFFSYTDPKPLHRTDDFARPHRDDQSRALAPKGFGQSCSAVENSLIHPSNVSLILSVLEAQGDSKKRWTCPSFDNVLNTSFVYIDAWRVDKSFILPIDLE